MAPPASTADLTSGTSRSIRSNTAGALKRSGEANGRAASKKQKKMTIGMDANLLNLYQTPPNPYTGQCTWTNKYPKDLDEAAENSLTSSYAILVRSKKSFDPRKKLEIDSIVIQSPLLKEALGDVLAGYPGISTSISRLIFSAPFQPFIHRWEQMSDALSTSEGETKDHFQILFDVLKEELDDTIAAKEDFIENQVISYEHLFTIFQPGCIIYHLSMDCALKLKDSHYHQTLSGSVLMLNYDRIEWDGTKFGTSSSKIGIPEYNGIKPITDLSCFPLEYHPQASKVEEKLLARGRLYEKCRGFHYREYFGTAIAQGPSGSFKLTLDDRIIIDRQAHGRNNPNQHGSVKHLDKALSSSLDDDEDESEDESGDDDGWKATTSNSNVQDQIAPRRPLTSEELLICVPTVFGYALKTKRWLEFYVDAIKPIKFNDGAFSSLVLPSDQKELILTFAESQIKNKESFDDVISGKGKGIIMLLSGGPGIGKTLTAESVAEHMKVPLFMMVAGDLGSDSADVEGKLSLILEMVTKWNAVLLLDECDVFLEARSPHDLERNKIVSIFLRTLEYYEGILFLTTNRISNMDAAFQSRIHITMEYPPLDTESRNMVWNNFLVKMDGTSEAATKHNLTEEEIDKLAAFDLNGRQIKNILKAAQLLAARGKVALGLGHLKTVLNVERRGAAAGL